MIRTGAVIAGMAGSARKSGNGTALADTLDRLAEGKGEFFTGICTNLQGRDQ